LRTNVLQELLLALERAVAGAQEGTGLVQPLADLVGGDDLIAHLGDGGTRLVALLAAGAAARARAMHRTLARRVFMRRFLRKGADRRYQTEQGTGKL